MCSPPPDTRHFGRVDLEQLDKIVDTCKAIGEAHDGASVAQIAIAWVVAKGWSLIKTLIFFSKQIFKF